MPFYSIRKTICFIWPAAILWNDKKSYEGVRLGFSYESFLLDEAEYLDKGNRKLVIYRDFTLPEQVDEAFLSTYLYEALAVDSAHKIGVGGK